MSLAFSTTQQVEHSAPQLGDPCSALSWLKPSNVDNSTLRHLCAQVANVGIWRFVTSDNSGTGGRMRLFLPDTTAGNWNYITDNGFLVANVWQCAAWTFDSSAGAGEQCNIYVGDEDTPLVEATYASTNDPAGTVEPTSGNLRFGRDTNGIFPFEGDIHSIMIWPGTILTLAELQVMQKVFRPKVAGCEIYSFYGRGGANALDLSGQGNNGTVTGATESDQAPLPSPFKNKLWTPFAIPAAGGDIRRHVIPAYMRLSA